MLKDVYLGGWENLNDMLHEFKIDKKDVNGYKVIVAAYDDSDAYSGDAFVLLKKGRNYYEVHGSHCSCYGLEDQWCIEESAKLALKHRIENGYHYGGFALALDTLKQHFRW